jgi:hypothetical protein
MALVPGTPIENRTWDQWCDSVKKYDRAVLANELRAANLDLSYRFARENSIPLAWLSTVDVHNLETHRRNADRFKDIVNHVHSRRFGLRFRGTGDFDVLALAGTKAEAIQQYRPETLGAAFIPILIGVLVVAAAVALIRYLQGENEVLGQKLDRAVRDADSKFCKDPNSPICKTWLERKKIEGYDKRQSAIDSLIETVKSGAAGLAKAVAIGIGIYAAARLIDALPKDRFEDRI